MPTTNSPSSSLSPDAPRWKCTVEAFEHLSTMGLLGEGSYELIEGDIVSRMPVKISHAYVIMLLTFALARLAGEGHILANFSLWVNRHNLPEPDLAVTERPVADLLASGGYVQPGDVRLVVEVSASTLASDLNTKATLYAGAGITEYWAMDVENRRLIVHRDPTPTGYAATTRHSERETVAPLFAPAFPLTISDLLPPTVQTQTGTATQP